MACILRRPIPGRAGDQPRYSSNRDHGASWCRLDRGHFPEARFERGAAGEPDVEIPPDVAADAEFLSTVMQGMAVMARAGAAPTSLSGTADTALRILDLD